MHSQLKTFLVYMFLSNNNVLVLDSKQTEVLAWTRNTSGRTRCQLNSISLRVESDLIHLTRYEVLPPVTDTGHHLTDHGDDGGRGRHESDAAGVGPEVAERREEPEVPGGPGTG